VTQHVTSKANGAICWAAAAMLLVHGTSIASADEAAVAAPPGAALELELVADGVQIYVCEAKGNGFDWSFKAPEATLFDKQGRQAGIHFAGPSWKLGDGSLVVGEVIAKADAPQAGAIQWLLLRAKSHEGTGLLSDVAFIRRADTKGGAPPKDGCDASQVSQQARMRYSAIYQFFAAPK
jgi:hypothetical protein